MAMSSSLMYLAFIGVIFLLALKDSQLLGMKTDAKVSKPARTTDHVEVSHHHPQIGEFSTPTISHSSDGYIENQKKRVKVLYCTS